MNAGCHAVLCALLAVGCASSEAGAPSAFDRSAGEARVVVGPDGFGTLDGQRMPLEAIVLRLRQRTRGLGVKAMGSFVVALGVQGNVTEADGARRMQADFDRMLQYLDIMDVEQVKLLTGGGP